MQSASKGLPLGLFKFWVIVHIPPNEVGPKGIGDGFAKNGIVFELLEKFYIIDILLDFGQENFQILQREFGRQNEGEQIVQ